MMKMLGLFKKHKILTVLVCIVLLAALSVLCINIYMVCSTSKYISDSGERASLAAADADCILVLGAGVWDGELSPLLQDRVDAGIELFTLGASDRLLMSGDHGRTDYDEVNAMKDYAAEKGIDPRMCFHGSRGLFYL